MLSLALLNEAVPQMPCAPSLHAEEGTPSHVVPANAEEPSVSAIALIAAARIRVSALEQTPSAKGDARGYGSRRSPGRPRDGWSPCPA